MPAKAKPSRPTSKKAPAAARRGRGHTTSRAGPKRGTINIKRAYDALGPDDGVLVLVDRLWPRGIAKSELKVDTWVRDLAPSTELRRWYGHDVARYDEFRRRYQAELAKAGEALRALRLAIKGRKATLVTATRDVEHSQAPILRDALMRGA
jgi:uncharacterized protein YeaO (DUF488 family)